MDNIINQNKPTTKIPYLVYTLINDVKVYILSYTSATGFQYDLARDNATRFSEAEAHNLADIAKRLNKPNLYLEKF